MESTRSLINRSRANSQRPILAGVSLSDTDDNHLFTMYWRMIAVRNKPVLITEVILGEFFYRESLPAARAKAREAINRLRNGWYIRIGV